MPEEIPSAPMEETVQFEDCPRIPSSNPHLEGHGGSAVAVKKEPEEILPTPMDESMYSDVCGTGSTVLLLLDAHGDNAVAVKEEPDESDSLRADDGSCSEAFGSAFSVQAHLEGQGKDNGSRRMTKDTAGRAYHAPGRGGPNKKLRFTVQEDIWLLREIVSVNPYEESARWIAICDTLNRVSGQAFTSRGCRERTERLLALFKQRDMANLRKSGTEEQYSEKKALLKEVAELVSRFQPMKRKWSMHPTRAATVVRRDSAKETCAALQGTRDSQEEVPESAFVPASPPVDFACADTSGSGEAAQATENAASPPPCPNEGHIVRRGKRKTLEAATDMLAARTSWDLRQLAFEERKLKLEEETLKLERERYENVELVCVRLEVERRRDEAAERKQRDDEHKAAMERELLHIQLLKAMLDKISP
ncbi:uncharacterized protein LOC8033287 [Ixodes scapularis]|uniref:uncharacterized protein LOC8033287 n=1 Tax=Ixodes scapularis TaxID=6945 RepID=UPI001A9DFC68|nr:uncharacterized protein LOC8033287 [Ixodes scapularis]